MRYSGFVEFYNPPNPQKQVGPIGPQYTRDTHAPFFEGRSPRALPSVRGGGRGGGRAVILTRASITNIKVIQLRNEGYMYVHLAP
jgi:hypothetical protein